MEDKPTINEGQMSIIRHSLGLNDDGTERHRGAGMFRNYYCAARGDIQLMELVTMGLMFEGRTLNDGKDQYFHVTDEGKKLAVTSVPKPENLSRPKDRYRRYLDGDTGETFGEWLKRRGYIRNGS